MPTERRKPKAKANLKMKRGKQTKRILKLFMLLAKSKEGIDALTLTALLDTPMRTIYRDIHVLIDAGIPIYRHKQGRFNAWKMDHAFMAEMLCPIRDKRSCILRD